MAIKDHFTLQVWHDYKADVWGEFHFARLRVDWLFGLERHEPWFAIDAGLLGLNFSLTFWPKGKGE